MQNYSQGNNQHIVNIITTTSCSSQDNKHNQYKNNYAMLLTGLLKKCKNHAMLLIRYM